MLHSRKIGKHRKNVSKIMKYQVRVKCNSIIHDMSSILLGKAQAKFKQPPPPKKKRVTSHGAASAVHTSDAARGPKSAASVHGRSLRDHLVSIAMADPLYRWMVLISCKIPLKWMTGVSPILGNLHVRGWIGLGELMATGSCKV